MTVDKLLKKIEKGYQSQAKIKNTLSGTDQKNINEKYCSCLKVK